MSDRDEVIREGEAHNLAEFIEHGPGLRTTTRTWILAKNIEADEVYIGGLGACGVGRMWTRAYDELKADPTYADAPEARRTGSDPFGAVRLDGRRIR